MKKEDLFEGMKIIDKDGSCLDYVGIMKASDSPKPKPVTFASKEEAEAFRNLTIEEQKKVKNDAQIENDRRIKEFEATAYDARTFEVFETGTPIYAKEDEVGALMERQVFTEISFKEWKKRVLALHAYSSLLAREEKLAAEGGISRKPKDLPKNYLDVYTTLNMSDKEVTAEYNKLQGK